MENLIKYGSVIIEPLQPSDFIAGVNSPLVLELLNTTRDWTLDSPQGERQAVPFETFSCVSQTVVRKIVARLNLILRVGILQKDYPAAYEFATKNRYIADGKFDCSERFLAVVSGTDPTKGNSGRKVCQAARDFGMVPEWMLPDEGLENRDEYYCKTPASQALLAKAIEMGKESKTYFDISWESIPTDLSDQYLAQAPVMWFIPICAGYESKAVVPACNQEIIHAVMEIRPRDPNKHIQDSYDPFLKNLAPFYPTPYAYQTTVRPKPGAVPPGMPKPLPFLFTRTINPGMKIPGERSIDVSHLQDRLGAPITGIYDDRTRSKVYEFQFKNILPLNTSLLGELIWLRGRSVGPKTRSVLNNQ